MPVCRGEKRIVGSRKKDRFARRNSPKVYESGAGRASSSAMIRSLLLEPDLWRYLGLCHVLNDSGIIEVLGEPDYAKILARTSPPECAPVHVVVLAHRLLLEHGIALVPMLRDLCHPCSVLVHGDIDSLDICAQVFLAGARGYYVLSSPPGFLPK